MSIETRSIRIKDIFRQFRGGKRKLLETLVNNPESDNWTRQDLADHIGISKVTLYSYMADEKLADALITCSRLIYSFDMPAVVRATKKDARTGNTQASKLVHDAVKMTGPSNIQSVNVAVHKDTEPTTLQIDTPEQIDAALAACYADMDTLKELITNLKAMRPPTNRLGGDGIHPQPRKPGTEEA